MIELLVVITVLGVLATIVLLAVNPGEQLARGRDTNRISAVTQLGRASVIYYSVRGTSYPPIGIANDWMVSLVNTGDVKVRVGNPGYGSTTGMTVCTDTRIQKFGVTNGTTTPTEFGHCYVRTTALTDAIVYVQLESERSKTKTGNCANTTWVIFATSVGKTGLWCSATEPTAGGNYTGSNFFEP